MAWASWFFETSPSLSCSLTHGYCALSASLPYPVVVAEVGWGRAWFLPYMQEDRLREENSCSYRWGLSICLLVGCPAGVLPLCSVPASLPWAFPVGKWERRSQGWHRILANCRAPWLQGKKKGTKGERDPAVFGGSCGLSYLQELLETWPLLSS